MITCQAPWCTSGSGSPNGPFNSQFSFNPPSASLGFARVCGTCLRPHGYQLHQLHPTQSVHPWRHGSTMDIVHDELPAQKCGDQDNLSPLSSLWQIFTFLLACVTHVEFSLAWKFDISQRRCPQDLFLEEKNVHDDLILPANSEFLWWCVAWLMFLALVFISDPDVQMPKKSCFGPDPLTPHGAITGGSRFIRTNKTEWKSFDLGEFWIKHALRCGFENTLDKGQFWF